MVKKKLTRKPTTQITLCTSGIGKELVKALIVFRVMSQLRRLSPALKDYREICTRSVDRIVSAFRRYRQLKSREKVIEQGPKTEDSISQKMARWLVHRRLSSKVRIKVLKLVFMSNQVKKMARDFLQLLKSLRNIMHRGIEQAALKTASLQGKKGQRAYPDSLRELADW